MDDDHARCPTWDEIVDRHSDRVYRLAYRLTGNRHDAEDLTQEVFVRVFRSLSTYTPGTFEGWLHRITTNLFLDQAPPQAADPLRRPRPTSAPSRLPSAAPSPDAAYADQTFDDDVERALATLPPDFRAAVVLCDVEGLTYEEIAEILGAKLGTVRSRIHRGRAMLREASPTARPRPGRARYSGPVAGRIRPAGSGRDRSPRCPGQRAARRPAPARSRSGPGPTSMPATPAATSSSARAGSRPGSPASRTTAASPRAPRTQRRPVRRRCAAGRRHPRQACRARAPPHGRLRGDRRRLHRRRHDRRARAVGAGRDARRRSTRARQHHPQASSPPPPPPAAPARRRLARHGVSLASGRIAVNDQPPTPGPSATGTNPTGPTKHASRTMSRTTSSTHPT